MALRPLRLWLGAAVLGTSLTGADALASSKAQDDATTVLLASPYYDAVPRLVGSVAPYRPTAFQTARLDPPQQRIAERVISEGWTAPRLYSDFAADFGKRVPRKVLAAALARMTPPLQDLFKVGLRHLEPTAAEAASYSELAERDPDAQHRLELARRIIAHVPEASVLKELIGQSVEAVADVILALTGKDTARQDLRDSFDRTVGAGAFAQSQREAMAVSAALAYRDRATGEIDALANALDSEAWRQLEQATLESLLAGAKQARHELISRAQQDLKGK